MGWEKLIVPLCPPPLARLGTSGVPGSFLALTLTPDVTLGQTLIILALGLCLFFLPKERKGSAHHCSGMPHGPKGKRRKPERKGWAPPPPRTRIPFSTRFISPPCPNPQPHLRDSVIPPFLHRSGDLSTYLYSLIFCSISA